MCKHRRGEQHAEDARHSPQTEGWIAAAEEVRTQTGETSERRTRMDHGCQGEEGVRYFSRILRDPESKCGRSQTEGRRHSSRSTAEKVSSSTSCVVAFRRNVSSEEQWQTKGQDLKIRTRQEWDPDTTVGIAPVSIQLRKYSSHMSRLDDVAGVHGGVVGLHRRFFARWPHCTFLAEHVRRAMCTNSCRVPHAVLR